MPVHLEASSSNFSSLTRINKRLRFLLNASVEKVYDVNKQTVELLN